MLKIYTHDEAARIVDLFEEILIKKGICVPSPEDDERGEDNMLGLYGTTYGDLLDAVEDNLAEILLNVRDYDGNVIVVTGVFSGNA